MKNPTSPTPRAESGTPVVSARLYDSGFVLSDSNFYSLSLASDGCLYYTLCTHNIDAHGQVCRHDPVADTVERLGDLGEIVGEADTRTIPQGKSHSPYYESGRYLYFATHYGYYKPPGDSDRETPGDVPEGYNQYPGGHFIRYDMKQGTFQELAKAPTGEGILTFAMDSHRGRLYGLTWPRGHFIVYDLESGVLSDFGKVSRDGELGKDDQYFCLCRCFGIVPESGSVYWTNPDGQILHYNPETQRIAPVAGTNLKRDILGHWETHVPGHQGYNWRQVIWYAPWKEFIGVHPKSGYLFRFDPAKERLALIDRICADDLRRNGQFEPFRYGYLTLDLGPDGETLYYITGNNGLTTEDGRELEATLHLVTFNLATGVYQDHGVIRLEDGRYPTLTQSIAVHPNGKIYTAPWIENPNPEPGDKRKHITDLIAFNNPLSPNT